MLKISIITITYNSERTIEETIKSVISQNYPDVEYIIIDGGSKDGTLDIVGGYEDYIDTIISEPDEGICDAFNKGIQNATGQLIGIINSDDLLVDGALDKLVAAYSPEVDVYYGNGRRLFADGHTERYIAKPHERLKKEMALVHPATFIRKDAYERYGKFDLSYKMCMDRELLLRMLTRGARFKYIPEELAIYRMGGISERNLSIVHEERERISILYGERKWKVKLHTCFICVKMYVKRIVKGK